MPFLFQDKLLLGLILVVMWLPVPLGSNRMIFWSLAEILLASLMAFWIVQYARGRRQIPLPARRAWPALLMLLLWLLFLTLQWIPLPAGWVRALSPQAAHVHALAYHPAGEPAWLTLSVSPQDTLVALHKSIALSLLFLLVLLLVDRFRKLRLLAGALVLAATFLAGLAIGDYLVDWKWLNFASGGHLNASFANRNHFANYLALALSVGIGLLLAQLGDERPREAKERLRRLLDWVMGPRMRLRLYLLLMTAALIMTHSRMGNAAFFVSLLVAGVLTLVLSRRKNRAMVILLASLVVLDIFIMGSMVGLGKVVHRMERTSLAGETRDEVARDTWDYWRDYRLTGSGLGTFSVIYPEYKRGDVALTYLHAHNDYLEFAAETGLVGLALIGGFVGLSLGVALLIFRRRRIAWAQGIGFALLMSTVALLVHSTVEFNLQIFANAATYLLIAALGWVALYLPARREEPAVPLRPGPWQRRLAVFQVLALVAYMAWVARLALADAMTNHGERQLVQWQAWQKIDAVPSATLLQQAIDRQQLALRLDPGSYQARRVLARLIAWGMDREPMPAEERRKAQEAVLLLLLAASQRNPAQASTWLAMAYMRHKQGIHDGLFQVSLLRTARLAPWEPHVTLSLVRLGLMAWEQLSNEGLRRIVLQAILRAHRQKPEETRALLERLDKVSLVCRALGPQAPDTICKP